jgi:hypothetical protein
MPLNLASPGIVVREVDLTSGRVDPTSDKAAGIVAPFEKGPVEIPSLVETEADLLNNFGEPYSTNNHYEYWYTASSYLAYGGVLQVVRSDNSGLRNGVAGVSSNIKIKSADDYVNLGYDNNIISNVDFVAQNPGSWSNGLRIAFIDGKADQILTGYAGTAFQVGMGITQAVPAGTSVPGIGTTSTLDGYFKGIITGSLSSGASVEVKLTHHISAAGVVTAVSYTPGGVYRFASAGVGSTSSGNALSVHEAATGNLAGLATYTGRQDWFDQQEISLSGSTIKWNRVAERPTTTNFGISRNAKNDEFHVVVYDDLGKITGNAGTLLEKHLSLSKATDAEFSAGTPQYWRSWLQFNSENIFGGGEPSGVTTTGFTANASATTFTNFGDGGWDQKVASITFNCIGNGIRTLGFGSDYGGATGIGSTEGLEVSVGDLSSGYDLFENPDQFDIDYLLMGSGAHGKEETQSIANKIISVAEERQDVVAFVSPYRQAFLSDGASISLRSASDITDNLVSYYSAITSSSYAVFDSTYKYQFDRFGNTFRYLPMNGDIAGTCARNDINNFPWFSPAGTLRGAILNAVKLAYNPTKTQRDVLYSNRINPIIFSPGSGIVLFGDKTGLARASAFDRINVRRLFIYLEKAISAAARDQMFEFNDEITRTNFVSIVEPFLRDVQAKRGIIDFVVKCDETNNTAAVIDNNEFVADIYIKPNRSINFIGLTFVATRTGVSFDEVLGV